MMQSALSSRGQAYEHRPTPEPSPSLVTTLRADDLEFRIDVGDPASGVADGHS